MSSIPTWPVAALTLIIGFAVAQATGIRPLGGVVLLIGLGWCAYRWNAEQNVAIAALLSLVFLALFVGSHILSKKIGAWPSVFTVSAVMAVAAWLLADS